jgi:excisionase family DNA binding protein
MNELRIPFPPGFAEEIATRVVEFMGPPPEPYLNVEEAADYLRCKPKRIYELKAQGRLAHYRDGTRLLFRRVDLDDALQRQGMDAT